MPALYSVLESLESTAGVTALLELPDASYDTPLDQLRPEVVLRNSEPAGLGGARPLADLGLSSSTWA